MDIWHAPHEVAGLFVDPSTCLFPSVVRSLSRERKELVDVFLNVRCHCSLSLFLHYLFQSMVCNLSLKIAVLEVIIVHADGSFHWRYEVFGWTRLKWFCLIIVEGFISLFLVIMIEFLRDLLGID